MSASWQAHARNLEFYPPNGQVKSFYAATRDAITSCRLPKASRHRCLLTLPWKYTSNLTGQRNVQDCEDALNKTISATTQALISSPRTPPAALARRALLKDAHEEMPLGYSCRLSK